MLQFVTLSLELLSRGLVLLSLAPCSQGALVRAQVFAPSGAGALQGVVSAAQELPRRGRVQVLRCAWCASGRSK